MRKLTYLLLYFYFISKVLCVIPEWNLSKAGENLLSSSNEYKYTINHRNLFNVNLLMEKEINRTSSGEITTANYIKIDNSARKQVEFDQVESYYSMFGTYVICPKGSYHPYNFNEGEYIIPKGFNGENWDLNCYRIEKENNLGFILVFYFMNGSNKNLYLTNTKNIDWYDGMSIENVQIYHYLLRYNKYDEGKHFYQMMGILKNDINIELRYFIMTLKEGEQQTHNTTTYKTIINAGKFSQATFKNISENDNIEYFYYFTYNNISDLITGYSDGIDKNSNYYNSLGNIQITKNEYPHLEFFNDMEIVEMNFLLNNKFLYYKMEDQKDGTIYHGIFDIVLNKIIFNTKEKINTFIPHTDGAMLAITNNTAYKICAYKNGNDCTDTCSNSQYLLDISGNTCGSSCPEGKYLFKPSGVCIDKCDESLYVLEGNICQLCKDKDESTPYKLINGTECLSKIPENAENAKDYNEKLKLLECKKGYHREDNTCVENCYELCETCTELSQDASNQKCIKCITGFELDSNNNCQCPIGEEKVNKTCKNCTNECGSYKLNTCDCLSCSDGKYLSNNRCEQCNLNCSTCETSATKCTGCNSSFFLDNYTCYECPTNCKKNVTGSCKCESCYDGFYFDSYYCKNCPSNCKKCVNGEKCNECNSGFYKENDLCNKCEDICETCDGKKDNDTNYHCLSCDITKEEKYLINDNDKGIHICVKNCSEYNLTGGTTESNKHVCIDPEKEKQKNKEKENDVDYMLWIFVAIIAVILIIISVFICKKICSKNNEIESIDEVEGELIEQ